MDKKNLLPNQGAPVIRGISGKLPSHLAELSEEALGGNGLEASATVSICAFDGAEASATVSICAFDGAEASATISMCAFDGAEASATISMCAFDGDEA
ncbi:MAG: microcyclamide/patellamide family RiPP [Microcystis aeruginosa LG13-03]|nr:microcyclamide/patellamide family RiPP [Microcystis aeruginosa LG13-13]NCR05923.1 microcyclamide/patellamide family RiPP [Microcystis aeruginosa LG13-03]NCR64177.1 microcyclamide/patellamide family RiPP [Microcystis aeruginosa LG11-05]